MSYIKQRDKPVEVKSIVEVITPIDSFNFG